MSDWESTQNEVQACRRCEQQRVRYLRVPAGEKRNPPWEPLSPIRLYFVSVAPPSGGAYFWDETARDAVRDGLFRVLRKTLLTDVTTCRKFRDLHLFLTPAVKCPSAKTNNIQGGKDRDHPPSSTAVANCGELLRSEIMAANPEGILALGAVPFRSLCDIFGIAAPRQVARFRGRVWWIRLGNRDVPIAGTYFTGNNRHKGFEKIVEDIDRMLTLQPRTQDA